MANNILFRFSHGLGDVTQFTVVLKHLRKYRPDWIVDVRVSRGKETALVGLCNRVFHDKQPEPPGPYDKIVDIGWYENYNRYPDRPNTKITNCLQEVFNIQYDPTLGRYSIQNSPEATERAEKYLQVIGGVKKEKYNTLIIHYEGNTSQHRKNLGHWQAQTFCEAAMELGLIPVILDWDNRSPLPDNKKIFKPHVGNGDIYGGFGTGDAATIAALINLSTAFIGVDSGPGKVASATNTPSLICWKEHHPMQFHDPADNTTHLVPWNHETLTPCSDNMKIAEYFQEHYKSITYHGPHELARTAADWLANIMGKSLEKKNVFTFVVPPGIGDSVWALLKIKDVYKQTGVEASQGSLKVAIATSNNNEIGHRSVPFLRRFDFIDKIQVLDLPIHPNPNRLNDDDGRYIYETDGPKGPFYYLMPNGPLERGERIENWLPSYEIDWDIINHFSFESTDKGKDFGSLLDPFVAFYLGPEQGNVEEGHNRGFLWEPKHWNELGRHFTELGMNIAVVGADYDRSYWERYVREGVGEVGMEWYDMIGRFEIGETFAFLKQAKCFISYQCGLGIFMQYLGQKVAMWWRQDGDSCHPSRKVCFSDKMKDAWTRPEYQDRYMGMLYGRENVKDIINEIERRQWLK